MGDRLEYIAWWIIGLACLPWELLILWLRG